MTAESIIILSEVFFIFLGASYYQQLREQREDTYIAGRWAVLLLFVSVPSIWQCLLAGKGWGRAAGALLLVLMVAVWYFLFYRRQLKLKRSSWQQLLIWYMLIMVSLSGIDIFVILNWEENGYGRTILTISIFVLVVCMAEGILRMIRSRGHMAQIVSDASDVSGMIFETVGIGEAPMGRRELLVLMGMIALYGVVTFTGLGSRQMPQTYMELTPDESGSHEIILDMGEKKNIKTLYLHLGHMLDRTVAVSWYDEGKNEWVSIVEDADIEANYNWNEVAVDKELRYLGIVSRSGKAVFHEIVLLDDKGEKLLPVNAEDYPLLFDEQALFPETITYYYRTMFDEVYYAGSAYEFLHGMKMFEETHPPMGKLLIAFGEWLFGVNPFGWRFTCALFGTAMLPLIFYFLYRMFKNSRLALIGTALLSLDFMHYTLARIATLDTIIAFFILAIFALMWRLLDKAEEEIQEERKRPSFKTVLLILLCAFATGMGCATKWTGFYAMAGIAVFFLVFIGSRYFRLRRQKMSTGYLGWLFLEGVIFFGLIPLSIYVLSFLPQSIAEGGKNVWKVMWESSLFMLNFHSDIVFDHPYSSPWYTWSWMRTPLMDAGNSLADGRSCVIVTMGNPVIWWCGLASFFHMMYRAVFKKDYRAGYLGCAYLFMYMPWFFVKRTVFIYQYYGSSLFMICMLAYSLCLFGKKYKKLVPLFLEAALFLFILFFPVISGYPVSNYHLGIYLEWLRSWKFVWL